MGQRGRGRKTSQQKQNRDVHHCGLAGNNQRRKQLLGAESEPSGNKQSREKHHGGPSWAGRRASRDAELQQLIISPWQTGGSVVLPNPLRLLVQ